MSGNLLVILGTIVVPSVVICFVTVVSLVNLYLNIRRRFPAKVNCWFCNHDTRVPYDQTNSFVCPGCKQYNGFTADGDYNREIPEQYQQRLNNYHYHHPSNVTDDDKWDISTVRSVAGTSGRAPISNGLCFGCNRNQELKIHQLASFVPEDENNYDAEVDEYRKQLEQAYKICGRCERVLKRALNDVKRNILGSKLAAIGSKSLNVLDMHMRASTKKLAQQKRQRWAKFCVWAVTGLLLVKLHQNIADSGWTMADLMRVCPAPLLTAITVALSYALALRELLWKQVERVLAEPNVQESTECLETFGTEMLYQYVPRLMETSAHYFEAISEQMPTERSSPLLLNVAIVALSALLASLGTQRTVVKQLLIVGLCAADGFLLYAQYQDTALHTLLLNLGSLVVSVSCIGQRLIRSDVPTANLNSSFHKIYSHQCRESDYSDVDTTGGESSFNRDLTAPNLIPASTHRTMMVPPPSLVDAGGDLSGKSLDTTKSGSPSMFSISPTNPFLLSSHAGGSPPIGSNKISGSLFNVAHGGDTFGTTVDDKMSVFSRRSSGLGVTGQSLLKTPSFSVDNFQTVSSTAGLTHRRNGPRTGPPSIGSQRVSNFGRYRHSMSTINQEEDPRPFRGENPMIEEDIDRLSISGRVSMNSSGMQGSRVSLGNPFASLQTNRPEGDYDELVSCSSRGLFRPPEPFSVVAKDSLWAGLNGPQTHMSRTSSQSSGFESQAGTTRRNTPTEGDAPTGPSIDDAQLEISHPNFRPRGDPPSPVPSSASAFDWNTSGAMFSNRRMNGLQQHSLFNEHNLFNSAQPPVGGGAVGSSGLFFLKLPRTSTLSVGSSSNTSTVTGPFSTRHIFPPQQSQTPSYHHQYGHSPSLGVGGSFGSAGFLSKPAPSIAGTSFYTSNKSAVNGRASLLNLSKLTNELNNGPVSTG